MRILYLCHRIPYPPDKGEKIRAFHQLRAMSERHEVDLFTLADRAADLEHRSTLARFCRQITVARFAPKAARLWSLPFLLTRTPLTIPYFYSRELDREVRAAVLRRSYDRVYVYCSAMAQYVPKEETTPAVIDLVDLDSDKWIQYAVAKGLPLSIIYRREGNLLREYERAMCERFSCVLVTTEREARLVRQLSETARVHVIPNGVDTDYFKPPSDPIDSTSPTVTFVGDMSYFPNQQAAAFFAIEVLPVVQQAVPGTRFLIVGRNPSHGVRQLQKIDGVEVTGYVPDVRDYLAKTSVAVAPFSIATGIQNKILEAMAYGLPVVGTSRAIQGLLREVGEVIETGESPKELAAKVLHFLRDPQLARRTGMEGRRRVSVHYSWEQALNRLLELIENPALMPVSGAEACSSSS